MKFDKRFGEISISNGNMKHLLFGLKYSIPKYCSQIILTKIYCNILSCFMKRNLLFNFKYILHVNNILRY